MGKVFIPLWDPWDFGNLGRTQKPFLLIFFGILGAGMVKLVNFVQFLGYLVMGRFFLIFFEKSKTRLGQEWQKVPKWPSHFWYLREG